MKIVTKFGVPEKEPTEALVVGLYENTKNVPPELETCNRSTGGMISYLLKNRDFRGKLNETLMISTYKKISPKRILLVGLGKVEDFSFDKIRQAYGTASRLMQIRQFNNFSLVLCKWKDVAVDDAARTIIEGALLSLYHFTMYKTLKKGEKSSINSFSLLVQDKAALSRLKTTAKSAQTVAEAVCFARDVVNMTGSDATPSFLANKAKEIAKKSAVKCTVLSRPELKKIGMGGVLGVSRGSTEPPKFIVLEYKAPRKTNDTVVIIGKGLTFDSGGLCLKPGSGMDLMKGDMAGGAAILGTFMAIANLKPSVNVIGLIPCVENMLNDTALKPGDIVKCLSGKTVEVLNTDAEGRLILADALGYAKRYNPDAVIDIATLTGSCVVALGTFASGMFGNNSELKERVRKAGENCHERVWELPLWDEYQELIKSHIADMKNIGGKYGGSITAACFLSRFVEDFPWVHLDIAGTFMVEKDTPNARRGATGVGVRLLTHLIQNWKSISDVSKKSKKQGR
ncbi:MAG: leucyl aminopeptidase [Planctomycetes bacterium]|nr:leucyl aminopeptidase [Planctomycetota bacterium]